MGWVVGRRPTGYSDRELAVCLPLKTEFAQGIFHLHITALHAERETLRSGVGTVVLSFVSFVIVPAAVVLGGWQIHQDQSRYLVKYDLAHRF